MKNKLKKGVLSSLLKLILSNFFNAIIEVHFVGV